MNYKKLPDICNITTGKLDANAAVAGGAYPFFTCAPEPTTIDTFTFDCDAILLAGNNAQGNFHITRYNGKFNAYQRTYVITAKDGYNIDFIKYMLELSLTHFKSQAQGSQTKFLTIQILNSFSIPDIPMEDQFKIASPLVALDRRIDNNNNICAELEDMAKILYDYWFVQFDFPDENGKPYRTSGGTMEWCQELGREVPKGWKVGTLSDIANITMGQSPAGESYNENGDGMMFFQGSTDFGGRFPMPRVYTTAPTRFAKTGDILMSVRAPVGALNIAMEDCCIGRGLAALNSKIGSQIYLIQLLNNFRAVFDSMNGNGTTFGSINKDTLYALKVIIPPNSVLQQFEEIVTPIEKQIRECEKENRELSSLRDWLLPMLMNGQARVLE